jgi:predicted ATP-grasp superfamily ATP-dependent carboligase
MRGRIMVTDAQERAVLAAIRCLSGAGYEVTALASSWTAPGLWSRAAAVRRLGPDPRRDVDGFGRTLQQIVRESRHDTVLPGTDAALFAISQIRERLSPYVRLGLPSAEVVAGALDRERLGDAARCVDLDPPDEVRCADVLQAVEVAERFGYPVLVKPVSTVIERRGALDRRASVLADDDAALCTAVRSLGDCIVQRRVRGELISFGGVATDAGLLGSVVSRYSRTWPPRAGNASFSETIRPPDGLAERVNALLARLGWTGLFELELIDRGQGRFAAIDFNPRAYGSMSIAAAAGVPLAALWCAWLLGERPHHPRAARVGVRYRWGEADLSNALWRLRGSRRLSALRAIGPKARTTHPYLQLADPAPAAARLIELGVRTWDGQTGRHGRPPGELSSESAVPRRSSAP